MKNNKEEFINYLITDDAKSKELLLNLLAEKDYQSIKSIIMSLDRMIKKQELNKNIKENFLFLIAQNIDETALFDEKMSLKKEYNFLNGMEIVLLQKLLRHNYHFNSEQLTNTKDALLLEIIKYPDSLNCEEAFNILTTRIQDKSFTIDHFAESDMLNYLKLASKLANQTGVEELINDETFISLYNSNNITLPTILLASNHVSKPRLKIITADKSKTYIKQNPSMIANLLTSEEVAILWQDTDLKNLFINQQLRYDCLDAKSQKNLLENIEVFSLYSLKTIKEFIKGYENKEVLIHHLDFLFTYFTALNKEPLAYDTIDSFINLFDEETLFIITDDPRFPYLQESIILYLINSLKPYYLENFFTNAKVHEVLLNNKNVTIYTKLPVNIQKEILASLDKLLLNNVNRQLFLNSNDDLIKKIFKQNDNLYNEILDICLNEKKALTYQELNRLIKLMPSEFYEKLTNEDIYKLSGPTIIAILGDSKNTFRKVILDNEILCSRIVNSINSTNITMIQACLLKITDREKVSLLTKAQNITNPYGAISIIKTMTDEIKKELYQNRALKNLILFSSSTDYLIDNLTISYLLENKELISKLSNNALIEFLTFLNLKELNNLLKEESILSKILSSEVAYSNIITLLNHDNLLLSSLINNRTAKYLEATTLIKLLEQLSINDKKLICTNEDVLLKLFDNNQAVLKTFKNLYEKNNYLLDSLDLKFLNSQTIKLKFAHLEYLTKHNDLQQLLLDIYQKYPLDNKFLTTLFNNDAIGFNHSPLSNILKTIVESIDGINRKKYGNFLKIFANTSFANLSVLEMNKIISYYLSVIPWLQTAEEIKRPAVVSVPRTLEEVLNYEENYAKNIEEKIRLKDYDSYQAIVCLKYYKMTLEEATTFINQYDVTKITEKAYQNEINFLQNLNHFLHQPEKEIRKNKRLKEYKITDIFKINNRLHELFNKLYNYELNINLNNYQPLNVALYGKEITLYEPKEKFTYLLSSVNPKRMLNFADFLSSWNDTLASLPNEQLTATLITNDNLHVFVPEDINFGFTKLNNNTLENIILPNRFGHSFFALPRTLINNSSQNHNLFFLNKYENNNQTAKNPYLTPDYLLLFKDLIFIDDETIKTAYLEYVYRTSQSFKTKKTPNGLPIILLDRHKIITDEVGELKASILEYNENHNVILLKKIIEKYSNNQLGLAYFTNEFLNKFAIQELLTTIEERLKNCHNLSELSLLKELFTAELTKYNYLKDPEIPNKIPYNKYLKIIESKLS